MPKFTTISPTNIRDKKRYAWERFRDGGYVAIGWLDDTDLSGKSIEEVIDLIRAHEPRYENEPSAIKSFKRFLSLDEGDCVAVNNANHGIFGAGFIKSDDKKPDDKDVKTVRPAYRFEFHGHDTGAEDESRFYSHYMGVHWEQRTYAQRKELIRAGETGWQPFGTVGKVYPELPEYMKRYLGMSKSDPASTSAAAPARPPSLEPVIQAVETLRRQQRHTERDHESLVEGFFVSLGYRKYEDIKYRQGRVDIVLQTNGETILVVEVKPDWDLTGDRRTGAVKQVYVYAHEQGVRHVLVTNGDTYVLFDRLKGLSWKSNQLGEFQITSLHPQDLPLIERLRPERMSCPDVGETLRHLAESFPERDSISG